VPARSPRSAILAELVDQLERHRIPSIWLSDPVSARQTDPLIGPAYAPAGPSGSTGHQALALPGRNPFDGCGAAGR
jgi:hypothetical protein